MDLSFFLTIQAPQVQTVSNVKSNSTGALNTEKSANFDLFFESFLQQGLISREGKIMADQSSKNTEEINLELDQTITSLEALLSKDLETAEIYNLDDFADLPIGQIIVSVDNEKVALPDDVKLALLDHLLGTPTQINSRTTDALQSETGNSTTSPFAGTEATLNGDDLFEKILENLNQNQGVNIYIETVIAAGVPPQQFEHLVQQHHVSLQDPVSVKELSEDLISLLGLVKSAPAQASLSIQKSNDPLAPETAWFNEDLDALPFGKEINSLEELKAALQKTQQAAHGQSKAAQIMAGTANENASQNNMPSIINTLPSENGMDWVDIDGQMWTSTPSLPSALNGNNLISVVTNAPHAHSAHPATQMLAVSIQKNSTSSESRNWTLQLDPPDLGKVEVELHFNKDKLVKTQMVIEKPETWMMLQRDAQVLERALQDAGLDVSSENLEFELAAQDHDFSGNGSHDGQNGQGSGQGTNEDTEIIETTMTWYTDTDTGLQRYNLVV